MKNNVGGSISGISMPGEHHTNEPHLWESPTEAPSSTPGLDPVEVADSRFTPEHTQAWRNAIPSELPPRDNSWT